jgi:hypothetical protein
VRDWEPAISKRMGGLKLCAEARHDVVRELASHFEQIYEDARERGVGEQQAREQALGSVRDWKRFARDVQYQKETLMTMTPFKRKVVMPGMIALILSGMALWVTSSMHRAGSLHVFYPVDAQRYFTFNLPWLIALPIVGAVGAWMSWRNGGKTSERLAAGIFPALTFGWVPIWGLVVAVIWLALNLVAPARVSDHAGVAEWMMRILSFLVPWVVAPAVSMAVGTLPFLWLKPHAAEEHPLDAAHA